MPNLRKQEINKLHAPLGLSVFVMKRNTAEVLIAACALLGYVGTLAFGFVHDDTVQIVQNPGIRRWGSMLQYFHRDVWAGLSVGGTATFYRPVYMAWLWLNYVLFGLSTTGWHFANVILHALASVLVGSLAMRILKSRAAGCAVGILFALHPAHVESVAWVSGATDLLLTSLVCGATVSYLEFRRSSDVRWFICSLILACLALLSKETAVVLPLLLAFVVFAEEGSSIRSAIKSLLAFLLLDFAYLVVRGMVLEGAQSFSHMTLSQMIPTWPVAVAFYVRQLTLPWRLSLYYDFYPVGSIWEHQFYCPLILVAVLIAFLWWWAARSPHRRVVVAASAWILISLLPVLNLRVFSPGQLVHDRYLYLPSVGFCMLLVVGALDVLEGVGSGEIWKFGTALIIGVSVVCIALILANEVQWASDLLLYKHSVEVAPRNAVASMNLGVEYLRRGDLPAGVKWLERSEQLDGNSAGTEFNLAEAYYLEKDLSRAERCIRHSLSLDPQRPQGWLLASEIALDSGDVSEALTAANQAELLWPNGPGYHAMVGFVLWRKGDLSGAQQAFREELSVNPNDEKAREALQKLNAGRSF